MNGNGFARSVDLSCIDCNRSASFTQGIHPVRRQDYMFDMLDMKQSQQYFCPSNQQMNAITSIMRVGESPAFFLPNVCKTIVYVAQEVVDGFNGCLEDELIKCQIKLNGLPLSMFVLQAGKQMTRNPKEREKVRYRLNKGGGGRSNMQQTLLSLKSS